MCSVALGLVLLHSLTRFFQQRPRFRARCPDTGHRSNIYTFCPNTPAPALRAASSQSHLFPGQHSPRFRESRQKTGKTGISRACERVFLLQISCGLWLWRTSKAPELRRVALMLLLERQRFKTGLFSTAAYVKSSPAEASGCPSERSEASVEVNHNRICLHC